MSELKEQVVKLSDAPLKEAIEETSTFVAIVGGQVSQVPKSALPLLTEQQEQDIEAISNKADKVGTGKEDKILVADEEGNLKAGNKTIADLTETSSTIKEKLGLLPAMGVYPDITVTDQEGLDIVFFGNIRIDTAFEVTDGTTTIVVAAGLATGGSDTMAYQLLFTTNNKIYKRYYYDAWGELSELAGGGGGELYEAVTYSALLSLISNNNLTTGKKYIITNHKTTYYQPITNEFIECGIEPLVVTASSANTLEPIAFSPLYPQDIIYYNVDDDSEGATMGKITRRIDTSLNNDIGNDFRHIKYRRWVLNVTNEWVQGDDYEAGDIVTTGSDIHICTKTHEDSGDLNTNFVQFPFYNGDFASIYITGQPVFIDGVRFIVPVSAEYKDRPILLEGCERITISHSSNLINIVLGDYNYNFTLGDDNYNFTFGNNNYNFTFGNDNYYFTLGNSNYNFTLGNYNYNFTLKNDNYNFTLGNNNYNFTLGNGNYNFTLGNNNGNFTLGNENYNFTLGNYNNNFTLGNYNYYFTFGNGNNNFTFGNDNYNFTFGNENYNFTLGDDNYFWTILSGVDFANKSLPTNLNDYKDKKIYSANGIITLEYTDEFGDKTITEL